MEELFENENKINYPYYEATYLDDNNIKHLANIEEKDVGFYESRFTMLSRRLINAN